eukprot:4003499-Karenia_brevis.AAC.1
MQKFDNDVNFQSVDDFGHAWENAFAKAATSNLSEARIESKRPWISTRTLNYILERRNARVNGDIESEKKFQRLIRQSVKQDRASWLQNLLQEGNWSAIQRYRKSKSWNYSKLRGLDGRVLASDEKAEGLAEYLEKVQWAVRPDVIPAQGPVLNDFNGMNFGDFDCQELRRVLAKLKTGKSSGDDSIPAEFWQLCLKNDQLFTWLLQFCNQIWNSKKVPKSWHRATVACLFKKGDPSLAENYRPISLLPVAYKIFSAMILNRFKKAGMETKLWRSQMGFRSGYGTRDAIFIARRMIEQCYNSRDKKLIFLALDWSKAFDSIDPTALIQSLRRFGVPEPYLEMINNIYCDRSFVVSDCGQRSKVHTQRSGISQGCPLSPFLFVMVLSVLLYDANVLLKDVHGINLSMDGCHEIVYADDILLVGDNAQMIQKYMECISQVGRFYGLSLNWQKLEQLNMNCGEAEIFNGLGEVIQCKENLKYLGAQLASNGHIESE